VQSSGWGASCIAFKSDPKKSEGGERRLALRLPPPFYKYSDRKEFLLNPRGMPGSNTFTWIKSNPFRPIKNRRIVFLKYICYISL
jgi:hypothetical protein